MPKTVSLARQLGLASATALVVSNMVGTGIFTTTGFLAGDLGSPSLVLLIWFVGAMVALAGAFCYSELGVNFPSSGGEYVYLTQAYGPVWGFMTGWVSFIAGFSSPIAAAALAFSSYLGFFFPSLRNGAPYFTIGSAFRFGDAELVACGLIFAMTLVNLLDLKSVAGLQNIFTGFKVGVLVLFCVAGFAAGSGNADHFSMAAVRTSSSGLFAQFAVSLCFTFTAYSGWNAATYVAEEIDQPAKTLPRALAMGTAIVALLYLALNVLFIYAMPLEQMKGVFAIGSTSAAKLFGANIGGLFSALMAIALFSTVNAMVTIGPRVYYAMAKNRAFFSFAGELSERTRTPINGILVQCAFAMIVTMSSLPSLMLFIGFTLNIFTVITVASLFFFRSKPNWQKLPVVSFMWPLFPVFYIIVGLWITYFGLTNEPKMSLTAFGMIALGALVYHFRIKDGVAAKAVARG
jgi:APA family basic amino acid/polyamine antiporter